ncbi:MAG: TlpA disulfide reductase family protein [Myxococcota bacterium]
MSDPAAAERSRGALFLLVALFAAAALWFVIGSAESAAPVGRGAPAPDFALPRWMPPASGAAADSAADPASGAGAPGDPSSGEFELASTSGRVVLVNFWATWCEPCEQEMPAMQRLYARLPRDRFELVAISIDEEPEKIAGFVERYGLTFPILMDPGKKVAGAYQTMGVPESLLVDRDGRIVERYVGPREWDAPEYVARIESLDAGSAGAAASAGASESGASPDAAGPRAEAPGASGAGAAADGS